MPVSRGGKPARRQRAHMQRADAPAAKPRATTPIADARQRRPPVAPPAKPVAAPRATPLRVPSVAPADVEAATQAPTANGPHLTAGARRMANGSSRARGTTTGLAVGATPEAPTAKSSAARPTAARPVANPTKPTAAKSAARRMPPATRTPPVTPFTRWRRGAQVVWRRAPRWARDWGLWATLLVAALLRIPPLARSPFTGDDALLLLEAARATHDGLLPATGIFSSLLALNLPFYTWLLLPFAAHPLGMAILTGVTNVAAVVALYLLGARYLGRATGHIAGLLFATATYPVWMSLFIWQQTLVPPFLLAVLWTLFLGVVDGKRHWLPIHTLLLAALIQIYPLTVTLLPLTLIGMALGWRVRRWTDLLDLPLAALGPALLFLPTALFEYASNGYDIRIYRAYLHTPARIDGQVFGLLRQAIGALPADYLGAGTPYAQVAPRFGWLGALLLALWAVSALWLFASLLAPRLAGRMRRHSIRRSRVTHPVAGGARVKLSLMAVWRGVGRTLADRGWRARLLVFLWPPFFLAATVRHASPIYIHYAFIALPVGYLTIGWALARLPRLLAALGGGALVGAQGVVTTFFVVTLMTGQATAGSWGGLSIVSFAQATALTATTAQQAHGTQASIASDPGDPYMGLYWALRGNTLDAPAGINWVSASAQDCALTPPHGAGPGALLVMAMPGLALSDLLASPGARLVQRIPMARGATYPLYQVPPNAAALAAPGPLVNGELRLDGATLAPAAHGLPTRIITHWTALVATPPGPAVSEYTFHFALAAPGRTTAQIALSCAPSVWRRGEGVTLAFPLPPAFVGAATPQLSVTVSRDTHSWYQPRADGSANGLSVGLTLETAKELTQQNTVLLPVGATQGHGFARPTQQQIDQATIAVPLGP